MLKRRSREIASEGVIKAQEWIGGQDMLKRSFKEQLKKNKK